MPFNFILCVFQSDPKDQLTVLSTKLGRTPCVSFNYWQWSLVCNQVTLEFLFCPHRTIYTCALILENITYEDVEKCSSANMSSHRSVVPLIVTSIMLPLSYTPRSLQKNHARLDVPSCDITLHNDLNLVRIEEFDPAFLLIFCYVKGQACMQRI